MILFHGSNIEIETVDFNYCRPYKDFGRGFYLTAIEEQAWKMAHRVVRIYGGKPCVTAFNVRDDIEAMLDIRCRVFAKPNKEWAMFVINNRNRDYKNIPNLQCNLDNKYDIVIGPIANDDLALLFRQFSNGLIGVDTLVKEMEYKKLTNQYSFHTQAALKYLQRVGADFE